VTEPSPFEIEMAIVEWKR